LVSATRWNDEATIELDVGFIATPMLSKFALFSSVLACVGSLYLAFILAFVLKDLCLVCIATYVVNAGLLWSNLQTVNHSRR
jgi:vitamin-K-epoxide reductase (warfarin-sensitive)